MRDLHLPLEDSPHSKYLRISAAIRDAVRDGRLVQGEALPSTRTLAAYWDCNRHTVARALQDLCLEGYLDATERQGFRVRAGIPRRPPEQEREFVALELGRPAPDVPPAHPAAGKGVFNLQSGTVDLRLFPMREFKSHLHDVLARRPAVLLGHDDSRGHGPLREGIAESLRRLCGLAGVDVVVTHGAQEALACCAFQCLAPGDAVAVEHPGYPYGWETFRLAGASVVPVPVDAHGMRTDALAELLRNNPRVRLIYTTPLHQYPTGVLMSQERRRHLYELACAHRIPIIEDDYDHQFHYSSPPPPPLAASDPAGVVLYVGSFSKVLYPSLRIGFIATPRPELARNLAKFRRTLSRRVGNLEANALAHWMREGGFERHVRRLARTLSRRNSFVRQWIAQNAPRWRMESGESEGGLSLWLDMGEETMVLAERARKTGVLVSPEADFRRDGVIGNHLRLGFAGHDEAELAQAMERLMRAASA